MNYGVIHGRFQPFHLDHLKYALAALSQCEYLFVGITNPDTFSRYAHASDLNRTTDSANPLSFWERSLIIHDCLVEANVDARCFSVVPFPIDDPYKLQSYVPFQAKFFITIYDDWGRHKLGKLSSYGLDVTVLWEREISQKMISGTHLRGLIARDDESWVTLVPPACAKLMKRLGLDQRIRQT